MPRTKNTPPPKKLIQYAFDDLRKRDRLEIANRLETARALWRTHEHMITADEMPTEYKAAFIEEHGYDPDVDQVDHGPTSEAELHHQATKAATNWANAPRHTIRNEEILALLAEEEPPPTVPTHTPDDYTVYELAMYCKTGDVRREDQQYIHVTRTEFLALKNYLKSMRGELNQAEFIAA